MEITEDLEVSCPWCKAPSRIWLADQKSSHRAGYASMNCGKCMVRFVFLRPVFPPQLVILNKPTISTLIPMPAPVPAQEDIPEKKPKVIVKSKSDWNYGG
jgi:hypothetical protein